MAINARVILVSLLFEENEPLSEEFVAEVTVNGVRTIIPASGDFNVGTNIINQTVFFEQMPGDTLDINIFLKIIEEDLINDDTAEGELSFLIPLLEGDQISFRALLDLFDISFLQEPVIADARFEIRAERV